MFFPKFWRSQNGQKEKHVKSVNISTTPLENNRTYKATPVWKTKTDFGVDRNSVVSNLILEENPTHLDDLLRANSFLSPLTAKIPQWH